jgi:hypothetical protein
MDGSINDENKNGKLLQIGVSNLVCVYCLIGKGFAEDHFVVFSERTLLIVCVPNDQLLGRLKDLTFHLIF